MCLRWVPKEEVDVVREHKGMHEDNFLSSWLREVGEDKKEREMEVDRETKEEVSKTRTREEEKEENETVIGKKVCQSCFDWGLWHFSQGEDSESWGNSWGDLWDESCGLSDCDSVTWTGVLVVIDVPVSPSSAVAEMCEGVSSDSDWECGWTVVLFFLQKAFDCLGGESRRDELRSAPVKAPRRVPEEGWCRPRHSRARTRQSRLCSGKLRCRPSV